MALIVLLIAALIAGLGAALAAALRYPRAGRQPATPHARLAAQLDSEAATGVALTLALILLAWRRLGAGHSHVRRSQRPGRDRPRRQRRELGQPARDRVHTDWFEVITYLGKPSTIAALAVVLAVVETARTRSRWVAPFLLIVVAGNGILTTTIKNLADRVRPELNPVAETLGPSFPSGHSSWSAAFFAAAALLLARGHGRRVQIALTGAAAGLAVAIAASRVLLDVHWLSDVVAGLALGWAWFAACAIAFGGRSLRVGALSRPARRRDWAGTPPAPRA